jgi:glucarate dehydratase
VPIIVEVETDDGLVGLGEMGGGGESAEKAFEGLKSYLIGHDPFELEALRFKIMNPTASLYNNRAQLHAAIEFGCLDLVGQKLGVPVHTLLGGKLRDRVPFASYLFFRYANAETGEPEIRSADQLVEHARRLKEEHGFTSHKLKGGVYPPEYELGCYRALASAFPEDTLRFDPNAAFSVEEGIRFGLAIEGLKNDYYEDPTWGLNSMRRLREKVKIPLSTNTVVIDFEQLATNVLNPAADVILLDTTFWGGIRSCVKAAGVCETFQLGWPYIHRGNWGYSLLPCCTSGPCSPTSPSRPMRTTTIYKTTSSTGACSSTRVAPSRSPMALGWASAWTGTSWTNTQSSTRSLEDILTTGIPDTRAVTPWCPSSASLIQTSP